MTTQPGAAPSAQVTALFIASEAGAPMRRVDAVRAVPGRGLEGDRYFRASGSYSRWPKPGRALTLIAEEMLEALRREEGVDLAPEESRRNVLTRGVDLNALVDRTFTVGEVTLRGVQRCQPCKYLARLTGHPGLHRSMLDRGGLRAQILNAGTIRTGDAVTVLDESSRSSNTG